MGQTCPKAALIMISLQMFLVSSILKTSFKLAFLIEMISIDYQVSNHNCKGAVFFFVIF